MSLKKSSMVMLRYFVAAFVLIFSLGLPGCGPFESEEVTLCQEAMKVNADQRRAGEEARRRLLQGCRMQAGIHTRDQWQCIIAGMKQGRSYTEMGTTCGYK